MPLRLLALTAALGLITAGCSGPPAAPVQTVAEVTGKVTVGGKPGAQIGLTFYPVSETEGREEKSGTNPDGTYTVRLVATKYKVTFDAMPGGPSVPKAYRDKATTTVEIEATGASMTKNFDLK